METPPYVPHLAAAYDRNAKQYRADDEIEVRTENDERLGGNLRRICRSFGRPIRVLEIGCGTGRYFHWLTNVALLVGNDLSAAMLRQAEKPVQQDEITAQEIRLIHGDIYTANFPPHSFDFIYSLGVFGYGATWTEALCRKVHAWLAPGGRLYFNAIEVPHSPNRRHRIKESLKSGLYPKLPSKWRTWLQARETVPIVRHSQRDIERVMNAAGFEDFVISTEACRSPLWNGVHLECLAQKQTAPMPVAAAAAESEPPRVRVSMAA